MKFYTNIDRVGSYILYRGYKDNKPIQDKVKFQPVFWIPSSKGDMKTMDGRLAGSVPQESMSVAKDFIDRYKDVSNFQVYGTTNYVHQFISQEFSHKIKFDPKRICVRFVDMEVGSPDGFPEPNEANYEINAITIKDSNKNQYHTWGLHPVDVSKIDKPVLYRLCKNEFDLLADFLEYWTDHYPDIVSGWYSELFDIPYLVNRMRKVLGEEATNRLSPWKKVYDDHFEMNTGKIKHRYNIVGITQLDYIDLFKKFTLNTLGQQDSYKLDNIAHVVLKENKLDYSEYGNLHTLYLSNYQKYIEYNIHDVTLVERLDEKLGLLQLVYTLAYKAKCTLKETLGTVGIWDAYLYNEFLKRGVVIPFSLNKSYRSIEGGYVKDPQLGLHKWVVSVDLNSLYPNLIIQYNMSPETTIPKLYHHTVSDVLEVLMNNNALLHNSDHIMTATGQCFRKDIQGIIPEIVESLYDERVIIKNQMIEKKKEKELNKSDLIDKEISIFNTMQMAIKILLNSLYGAMANKYFRFFNADVAEAITVTGQLTTQWAAYTINKYLNKVLKTNDIDYVIACDTDSVYFTLDKLVQAIFPDGAETQKIVDFCDKVTERIENELEKAFIQLQYTMNANKNKMVMKREIIADKAVWTAKKRYIAHVLDSEGVRYKEPVLKIVGIEAVRSSTPAICRKWIEELFKLMMKSDQKTIQKQILEYRNKFNELAPEDVAFPRGVSDLSKYRSSGGSYTKGTPIHVRAALLYNELIKNNKLVYEEIKDGEKMKFMYMVVPNPIQENVFGFATVFPKETGLQKYIDFETQFQKAFIDPILPVINAMGWTIEEQNTLENFFG